MRILTRAVPVHTRNWLLPYLARLPTYGQRIAPRTLPSEQWFLATGSQDTNSFLSTLCVGRSATLDSTDLDPMSLLALARVMSLKSNTKQERQDALGVYEKAMLRNGTSAFTQPCLIPQSMRHGQIVARLAIELGLFDRAQEFAAAFPMGSKYREAMKVDLRNPALNPSGSRENWLSAFNELAGWHGDWSISEGSAFSRHVLDNIRTNLVAGSTDGPLVTVVLPSYQPDPQHLRTAVRSVVEQTMGNLEILIVDDASGEKWHAIYEELAATDNRIRILYQNVNLGAYAARNAGMEQALGEFVTFHDSDDWAHPNRIEYQLKPLLTNGSKVIATYSSALKANDDLLLSYRSSESQWINLSSLLLRRKQVLDRAGYFVATRKGADSEYGERLNIAFPGLISSTQSFNGLTSNGLREPMLAINRMTPESLSRRDFSIGFAAPERLAFIDAFRNWHLTLNSSRVFVPRSDISPFPLPRNYRYNVPSQGTFDVVLAMDGRASVTSSKWWTDAMNRWSRSGLRIGFIHMFAPGSVDIGSIRVSKELMKAIAAGGIERLTLTDNVVAKTLVVPDPSVFSVQPPPGVLLATARTLINVSHIKRGKDDDVFVEKAVQICSRLFNNQPLVVANLEAAVDRLIREPNS